MPDTSAVEVKIGRQFTVLVPFNHHVVNATEAAFAARDLVARQAHKIAEADGYSLVVVDEKHEVIAPSQAEVSDYFKNDPDISVLRFTGLAVE